jgi:4-hydroxybenzoate polyprenyltransferase
VKSSITYPVTSYLHQHHISVGRELRLVWAFIRYDISTTLVPALLFMLAAYKGTQPDLISRLDTIALSLVYFLLYAYVFCLSNQIVGVEEDRRNKPDRPIVAGMVTRQGARVRMYVVMLLFALIGQLLSIGLWTALWLLVVLLHNQCGWSSHWFGKHLCMAMGVLAELAAAWQIVGPLNLRALIWVGVIALVMFPLVAVQDLRDMRGDDAIGRRTFPLVFGEQYTRLFVAVGFWILPLVMHATIVRISAPTVAALVCDVALAAVSVLIAARVLICRSRAADHRTYMAFTYWYCIALATAVVIL